MSIQISASPFDTGEGIISDSKSNSYEFDTTTHTGKGSCSLSSGEENAASGDRHFHEEIRGNGLHTGASLTWEDLWIVSPDSHRAILHGLSGYARPAEVLAIMGPSGCGKSTLLNALAGRLSSRSSQSGTILINGRRQTLSLGTSAYATQDDILMTTLTVREAVCYSAHLQLPSCMSAAEKTARAEETIREMGLSDAADTRIGSRWGGAKGLSGGQKRRVSICLEILTRPKLLFLDEPTSGLDSAASYHVVHRIASLASREGMTVVAAVHQPDSEVLGRFGSLCLLAYGKTVYFGDPSAAREFFASNGFPCPTLTNPADHYLRTINKDFNKVKVTEAIEVLTESYKLSHAQVQVQNEITRISRMEGPVVKRRNEAGFFIQSLVLTKRSFTNMHRDLCYYWIRIAIYMALYLCLGTLFYDIGYDRKSIKARATLLMFIASFLTFMTVGSFPSFVEDMKIFQRERLNGHYGVAPFVVAHTLSCVPFLALITWIPGVIPYYLIGLQKNMEHYSYFVLVLFTCLMLVESLMMIVASIVPDYLMGIITGSGIQGIMMLTSGYFRLPHDLPKLLWRYPMHYVAFHRYANHGFFKNEFLGLSFHSDKPGEPPIIDGEAVLRYVWQVNMSYPKWVDLAILAGMVVLYRVMFLVIIKIKEKSDNMMPTFQRILRGTKKTTTV